MDTAVQQDAPGLIPGPIVAFLFNAVPLLLLSFGVVDQGADFFDSQLASAAHSKKNLKIFDFVIVGGGSAGSVLANRLSESGDYTVLLLEAGGNPSFVQSVPGLSHATVTSSRVANVFYTVPQKDACQAMIENKSFWPRGAGLGGSSNLGGMLYQRGNKNDYDKWAELCGDNEWKFDNILRNFKEVEDYHGEHFSGQYHANNGKGVYVSTSNAENLAEEFLEAGEELGYPTQDVNGQQEASFSRADLNVKNGRRHSAYSAFIEPALTAENLKIYRYARVLQIKFNKKKKATGVSFVRHGTKQLVKARKEIILSAGTIDSAKILLLSGVGPKKDLKKLGITLVANLPVGLNLQDHVSTLLGPFHVDTPGATFQIERDANLGVLVEYLIKGTGPLSTPLMASAVGYVQSSSIGPKNTKKKKSAAPDIQLLHMPFAPSNFYNFEKLLNMEKDYMATYFGDSAIKDGFFIGVSLVKPSSRGEIKLASTNPMDKPIIDPKYFSDADDIKRLVDGMNFTVSLVEGTEALKLHGATLTENLLPGCETHGQKSRKYYECYARHFTLTYYNPCGTCRMGKGVKDPKAVVDSKLKVLHTKGLRVVDASVIPEIPNSNLNAAVYMIADKAAEMILEFWEKKKPKKAKKGKKLTGKKKKN